jgi:AcrR family transcriptional regulator
MTEGSYHHGDLPAALLAAVDEIVRESDVASLTLREVARRAGVSHAAPAHHFGDKAGLLTAYAAEGFAMLRDRMTAARQEPVAPGESPLIALGVAYVRFAVDEPGRFTVMFRPEHVHDDDPAYGSAGEEAFNVLVETVAELRTDLEPGSVELLLAATGAWSIVHGFATLWLDGNLPPEVTSQVTNAAAEGALVQFGATLLAALGALSARTDRP